jgi:uncharacterized membrane protein YeiH
MFIDLFALTDLLGTATFALSGCLVGIREKLDVLGITCLATLTALGGGMVRDAIVNRPAYSLTHWEPMTLVLAVVLCCLLLRLYKRPNVDEGAFYITSDAIGLVSFSMTGSFVAMEAGYNVYGVVMLALLTASGGGVLRDMLINRLPLLLHKEVYGTIAMGIGGCMLLLKQWHQLNWVSLSLLFVVGVTIRLITYYKQQHLPVPTLPNS